MEVHGRCHCGQIEFVTQSEPRSVICHCTDCQIMSGGPYRAITQTSEDDFRLTKGVLKKYYKTGDSGNRRELAFCGDCGSHIYATSALEDGSSAPRFLGIRVGVLREMEKLKPVAQVWTDSKVSWINEFDTLPGTPQQ